ncbi:DUF3325 domain-containing protein [Hydrogenophaga palleronii]|uniref:DUF3325 domain-containing protein n=1 Tax=Hydrogenophaga palleronii TaxID=65655 RepID=UPI0008267CE9|nr:DUF3325 domain-containing protein [Hydrogenophaga palleronii]
MNSLCLSLLAFGLCFAGMAALSLAMDRHHEQLNGRGEPSRAQRLTRRGLGTLLLLLALRPCLQASGLGVGLVAWCAWLAAGALLVALTLPYRPRWTLRAAVLSGGLSLLALPFA